jgi:serine protease Do
MKLLAGFWLCELVATGALAQSIREPVTLEPSQKMAAFAIESNATGFFVNETGDVVTARHVVEGCRSLFLIKDARVASASVKAVSSNADLAVITSTIKPLLAASFAGRNEVSVAQPVFAAGYESLRHMSDRADTIYNAFTRDRPSQAADEFTLISSATNGASGAPVLNQAGLVVGMVTERAQASNDDPRAYVARSGSASYVVALSADAIKTFLDASHVGFSVTDIPQLETMQAHAPRAATLEAGVLCAP